MKLMSFAGNLGKRGFPYISENHLLWSYRHSHSQKSFDSLLSNRTFYDDGNFLLLHYLIQSPLATHVVASKHLTHGQYN